MFASHAASTASRPFPRPTGGGALVGVILLVGMLSTLSLGALAVANAASREQQGAQRDSQARFLADAGIAQAMADLRAGGTGELGSADQPVEFAGGRHWVERVANDDDLIALVSTGVQDGATSRVEVLLRDVNTSIFRWGAFGDERLVLDSNATVDSYDSQLGSYADQAVNGSGSSTHANENGDAGSNRNIVVRQNARVYGGAHPGPEGSTTVMGNAVVTGSTSSSPELIELPPVEIPPVASSGPFVVPRGEVERLAPGTWGFDELEVETRGRLDVYGPAVLVFDSVLVDSNAEIRIDATGGPVEIYVRGDFVLNSNALVASIARDPADVAFFLAADNVSDPEQLVDLDEVDFDSNSRLYGTIYAPLAAIDINSNFQLFGAIVARRLVLSSWSRIHYDENLGNGGADGSLDLERVSWRLLAITDAPAHD